MSNNNYICPFSNIIINGKCSCQFSSRGYIAEKEFVTCDKESASYECQKFYRALIENSDFVFNSHKKNSLSLGQQSKLKMGALLYLQKQVSKIDITTIDNIYILFTKIKIHYQEFNNINYSDLMPTIAEYNLRKKN